MNRSDGGPAFPVTPFSADARNWSDGSEGMTLRDYFAAKALQGWIASDRHTKVDWKRDEIAAAAYRYADAMLASRNEVATGTTE